MLLNAARLSDGQPFSLMLLSIEDITENLQAKKLRESEERFRTSFERAPVAVYSCDAAGVIQEFNRRPVSESHHAKSALR